jgi:hypothetical protein
MRQKADIVTQYSSHVAREKEMLHLLDHVPCL